MIMLSNEDLLTLCCIQLYLFSQTEKTGVVRKIFSDYIIFIFHRAEESQQAGGRRPFSARVGQRGPTALIKDIFWK